MCLESSIQSVYVKQFMHNGREWMENEKRSTLNIFKLVKYERSLCHPTVDSIKIYYFVKWPTHTTSLAPSAITKNQQQQKMMATLSIINISLHSLFPKQHTPPHLSVDEEEREEEKNEIPVKILPCKAKYPWNIQLKIYYTFIFGMQPTKFPAVVVVFWFSSFIHEKWSAVWLAVFSILSSSFPWAHIHILNACLLLYTL